MRRTALALLVFLVWVVTFLGVWRNTETPNRPCNDVVQVPLTAAACVAQGPSLLPALPIATAAAILVAATAPGMLGPSKQRSR